MASNRKGVGLSAFSRNALTSDHYASHGAALRSAHADSLANQLSVFQAALHSFSLTHGAEIRSNPTFRAEFARMCNAIGVDPLASSNHKTSQGGKNEGGSFWSQMLGGSVNDFYFELAVRVVEVCRETRAENGGMIEVPQVRKRVEKGRGIGGGLQVSEYAHTESLNYQMLTTMYSDDILRAVKSLEPLGSGFTVMKIGSKQMIRSVPKELNTDQSTVLEAIQVLGYVTVSMLQLNLGWERARAVAVIDDLVADSLVWVDAQAEEKEYWSPALMHEIGGD
ncbi:EAP30 family protein Dot2 [Aureobasidium subglaciale]|nr:EAP30 family protein Dot2 [Aureobasidium subglaciale]